MEKSFYHEAMDKLMDESGKTLSVKDVAIRKIQTIMGIHVIFGFEEGGLRSDFYLGKDLWISNDFLYAKNHRYKGSIRIESLLPKATDEYIYGLAAALTIAFVSEKP
ncbi:hypothetical protein [Stutzerimonas kunmingensis]|uniref:Uncharacterized protein n=1 Tax=Stutzerimonas kunmingensis TaxID=1211807 RepID=A0A9X1SPA7_9GAMM|nr:hypothetical protein [Stutzerimonas kunmingensis]MCD1608647.1 hypothetical protein [Stutzerimonas kunmingensis]